MEGKLPRVDKSPVWKDDTFHVRFEKLSGRGGEMVAYDDAENWHYVDPFVDCAWPHDKAEELMGKSAMVSGFWHSFDQNLSRQVFIVREGALTLDVSPTLSSESEATQTINT